MSHPTTRRECLKAIAASGVAISLNPFAKPNRNEDFQFRYLLGSAMFGTTSLAEILPEVKKTGAAAIDLWPRPHGNQREQAAELGNEKLHQQLDEHGVKLGCISQYKLGPFGLQDEIRWAAEFGCRTIVTGAKGPSDRNGNELKSAVAAFVEQMKPHTELAAQFGITIAIENHSNSLIQSPDSLKWLAELRPKQGLGIALAPYHLRQDPHLISQLIRETAPAIEVFYAWQYGKGCMKKLPKAEELLQMPGRGDLDFRPIVQALREIEYSRWTEIFMHPVPRGVPILDSTNAVSTEINRSRQYLENLLAKT